MENQIRVQNNNYDVLNLNVFVEEAKNINKFEENSHTNFLPGITDEKLFDDPEEYEHKFKGE